MFQKMRLDSSRINISDLAERVLLGPQREILQLIVEFNRNFNTDLRATKTFRWSPGIYDKVREIFLRECLGWNVRTSKISTFFNKIENGQWRKRRMQELLTNIDNKMFQLRQSGTQFQDNTELVERKFNFLKNKVLNELDGSNNDIKIDCFMDDEEYDNGYPLLYFECKIPKGFPLDVSVAGYNGGQDEYLHTVNYPFDVDLVIQIPFIEWINALCAKELERINSINTFSSGRGRSKIDLVYGYGAHSKVKFEAGSTALKHPYISRNFSRSNDSYLYTCMGNLDSDIRVSLLQLDFISFKYHINNWASNYIVNKTNPMNNIKMFYHGNPKAPEKFYQIVGNKTTDECYYANDDNIGLEQPYCDELECQLRNTCNWYIRNYDEDGISRNIAYLQLVSELTNDPIEYLYPGYSNQYLDPRSLYETVLALKERYYKTFTFMCFYKDVQNSINSILSEKDDREFSNVTIEAAILTVERLYDEEYPPQILSAFDQEGVMDGANNFVINQLMRDINYDLSYHGLTFKELGLDFAALNKHFQWMDPDKVKKDIPSWIDTTKAITVKHSSKWYEDSDGVWRKISEDVPF